MCQIFDELCHREIEIEKTLSLYYFKLLKVNCLIVVAALSQLNLINYRGYKVCKFFSDFSR